MKKYAIVQQVSLALLASGLVFVFSACNTHKMYISESNLEKGDKITIGDYIVVSQFQDPDSLTWTNEPVSGDSVFSLFIQSVSTLGLPIEVDPNAANKIQAFDHRDTNGRTTWANTENIDTNAIKSMFPTGKGTTLIPVIVLQNRYASGSERFGSVLNFGAFIIRDGKLIYFNTCTFLDSCRSAVVRMHINYENREEWPKHTRQDWDKLVSDVMEPFTERVK